MEAFSGGDVEIIDFLLDRGVDLDAQDAQGIVYSAARKLGI
jgi:hypothetical protein